MQQFSYKGRDKTGQLHTGHRFAKDIDTLNNELQKEGINVINISTHKIEFSFMEQLQRWFQENSLHLEELAVFARQMQLLHQANVPMTTAIRQLSLYTRSRRLAFALQQIIIDLDKGQSLSKSMQQHPNIFSPVIVSIVEVGENTGKLSEAFAQIHQYLEFEANTRKQIKNTFRYPLFVLISILSAFVALNIFVIPTFARFYVNLGVSLPWETRLLIGISHLFTHYGTYLLILLGLTIGFFFYYISTPRGKYALNKNELRVPVIGGLLKRIILIRFAQSFAIILNARISFDRALTLVKNTLTNVYVVKQMSQVEDAIGRGLPFTQAIVKVKLFTPLEIQILSVGERNGELGAAFHYIAYFHNQEIEYDLKRINDLIGPVLISTISILILIMALAVYLPVWNMVNLIRV